MAANDLSISVINGAYDRIKDVRTDFSWAPPLVEAPIHSGRNVKIICVGAGFSGICTGVQLQQNGKDWDLQMYEKADDVGGVWHNNKYPGVACDVPCHSYQFSFCEQTQWSAYYAPGGEIQQYLKSVSKQYDILKHVKLSHEVIGAKWDEKRCKWDVQVRDLKTDQIFVDSADFFVYATGLLSKPMWPKIPGIERYKGELRHSGLWDVAKDEAAPDFTWKGKRVGVIGNGASGVQIVPYLQKRAEHVINFGRSRFWLSSGWGSKVLNELQPGSTDGRNHIFTEKERERFKDPEQYREFRKAIETDLASTHDLTLQGHPLQDVFREKLAELMLEKCAKKPAVADALLPDFPVGCRRLTPGPGYLAALQESNCDLNNTDIAEITETGIKTIDGKEHELDMIVCATGYDVRLIPGFPIIGVDGIDLQNSWAQEPRTYLGIAVPEAPNFFNLLVAQSVVGSGSLLVVLEAQAAYLVQMISKCQRDGYKRFLPKKQAVDDFMKFTDDYLARTVYTANCRSWFKNGQAGAAQIRTIWPGSGPHCFSAMKYPRWEDYDWERLDEHEHTMSWLGNGGVDPSLEGSFTHVEMRKMYKDLYLWT